VGHINLQHGLFATFNEKHLAGLGSGSIFFNFSFSEEFFSVFKNLK